MRKENEIVRSFLFSNFHWLEVECDDKYISKEEGYNRGVIEGKVNAKGKFYSFFDDKPIKTFNSKDEIKEWLPENILHESFNDFVFDRTGEENLFEYWSRDLGDDTSLLLEIHAGTLSGVGYNKGFEIRIGIAYKGMIFKLYDFKIDHESQQFQLGAYYDLPYLKSINFDEFVDVTNKNRSIYMPDYYHRALRVSDEITDKDLQDIFSIIVKDGVVTFEKEFIYNFKDHSEGFFPRNVLKHCGVKKIIMKDGFEIKEYFDIPDSLETIELDYKPRYANNSLEDFLDRNKDLGKYLTCDDDCDRIAEREKYNKECELSNREANIYFKYHELEGFVGVDEYQVMLFEEHYKDVKEVDLKIGDLTIKLSGDDFWKAITIEKAKPGKSLKYSGQREKAISYFDNRIGYTHWFPESIEEAYPRYKYEEEEDYA